MYKKQRKCSIFFNRGFYTGVVFRHNQPAIVGSDRAVVSIKNVIRRKPRSTMGVRSTLIDLRIEYFFDLLRLISSICAIVFLIKMHK